MNVESLDSLLAELLKERPAVVQIIEGLRHQLEQADIIVTTRQEVEALLAVYEIRDRMMVNLDLQLTQARVEVLDLLDHGYPALPERETDGLVYDDLDQNLGSIVAAIGQFKRRVLTTEGASEVGPEEPIS